MRLTVFLLLGFLLMPSSPVFAADEGEEVKQSLYYELKPSLIANLFKGGRYIRCDIQLMTRDEDALEQIKLHSPAIRHQLLLLMAEQDGKALKNAKGKEALRKKALGAANKTLADITENATIEALFFTSFIVQ